MSVMVSVEMPVLPEMFGDAVDALRGMLPDTRAFDGCELCDTYLDHDASRVLLVEKWASSEHQQAYLGWRIETGFLEQFGPFLSGEPVFSTWQIAADV